MACTFCVPLLLIGILAEGEETKSAPAEKKKSEKPATATKTAGNAGEPGAKQGGNLEIPAALPEDARKALETAVEAYRAAGRRRRTATRPRRARSAS